MCACKGSCKCSPSTKKGDPGTNGLSAYQLWVAAGNTGTLADFLASLVGPDGQSAYELAVAEGFVGNEAAWLASLVGAPGINGTNGTNGTNGLTPIATLSTFTMPFPGFAATAVMQDTDISWMRVGLPVSFQTSSSPGATDAWFIVATTPVGSSVQLLNPGPVQGFNPGVSYNPAQGTVIATGTKVVPRGRDGIVGAPGNPAPAPPTPSVVYSIPAGAQLPGEPELRFYANAAPPATATIFQPYSWDGASWVAGPNIAGARGTNTYFGTSDPNLVPPAGAQSGDVYVRSSGSNVLTYYRAVTPTTYIVEAALSLLGTATQAITHNAPGVRTLDLGFFSYFITADKDIELDYSFATYNGNGTWRLVIENVDAAPINVTYTVGRWEQDPAATLPATIAAGVVRIFEFTRNEASGLYVITSTYIPAAV